MSDPGQPIDHPWSPQPPDCWSFAPMPAGGEPDDAGAAAIWTQLFALWADTDLSKASMRQTISSADPAPGFYLEIWLSQLDSLPSFSQTPPDGVAKR